MKILINQQEKEVDQNTDLAQLMRSIDQETDGIAVAVNQEVISKDQWGEHVLKENDKILMIQATQGG